MSQDTVVELKKPASFVDDPITEILRKEARKLLSAALEAEIDTFFSQYKDFKDGKGRRRGVHNGYLPEQGFQTGMGNVPIRVSRIRDRQSGKDGDGKSTLAGPGSSKVAEIQ